jgi:hypothetical protein
LNLLAELKRADLAERLENARGRQKNYDLLVKQRIPLAKSQRDVSTLPHSLMESMKVLPDRIGGVVCPELAEAIQQPA